MTALLSPDQVVSSPIEEGDAGIILKTDGTFRIFNTHNMLDPDKLTEAQLDQGKKLIALAAALQVPALMDMLMQVAVDPNVFSKTFAAAGNQLQ